MGEVIVVNLREYAGQAVRVLELHADYACANSGECCEEPWGIQLMEPEARRLEGAFAAQGRADEFARVVLKDERPGETGYRFAAGECGCALHSGRGVGAFCTLHAQLGHGALPTICQSFPRMAVRTPAGIYLTLSNACPTAAQLLLKPVALGETAPRGVLALHPHLGGAVFGDRAEAPRFGRVQPGWEAFDYFWRWASTEWMANGGLSPSEALYGLGLAVGHIEGMGAAAVDAAVLIDTLDQIAGALPGQLVAARGSLPRETLLQVIYFETLLNMRAGLGALPPELAGVHALGAAGREALAAEYDRVIRPALGEFELIERNYVGQRLFANPLVYRAAQLRSGYFIVVLTAIALRGTALALCLREGVGLSESVLLRAAGIVDKLLLHQAQVSAKLAELIEGQMNTDIRNLAAAGLG